MEQQHRGLSVLVVGGPADVDPLVLTLEALGCEVAVAPSGRSALDLAQLTQPDAVILADGRDGLAACLRSRSAWRRPYVLALTDPGAGGRSSGRGVDLYAERPADPDLLLGLIGRLRGVVAAVRGFDPVI